MKFQIKITFFHDNATFSEPGRFSCEQKLFAISSLLNDICLMFYLIHRITVNVDIFLPGGGGGAYSHFCLLHRLTCDLDF